MNTDTNCLNIESIGLNKAIIEALMEFSEKVDLSVSEFNGATMFVEYILKCK